MHVDPQNDPQPIIDLAGDHVVLVAGSSRSGTTWVQQIINYRGDHRVIFEPFHPDKVDFLPAASTAHRYLRPADPAPLFTLHARRILQGQFHSPWTDQLTAPGTYYRRLIKAVRANLMLPWLMNQMPAMKVVLLLRHPCAVSHSWCEMGWRSDLAPLRQMSAQPHLVADYLAPFCPLIEAASDPFDLDILFWAVQNYVRLKQFGLHPDDAGETPVTGSDRGQVMLLFYEELCANPAAELSRLLAFLDLPLEPAAYVHWLAPSATVRKQSAVVTGESSIGAWQTRITPRQLDRAMTILRHFGLHQVYTETVMPCYWENVAGDTDAADANPTTAPCALSAQADKISPPQGDGRASAPCWTSVRTPLPPMGDTPAQLISVDATKEPEMTQQTQTSPCTKESLRCLGWLHETNGLRPDCCTAHLREILFFVDDLLTELGISHWIDFGTLLGAVRHGAFIPWDEDVDISFVDSQPSMLPLLAQLCTEAGYAVEYKAWIPDELKIHYSENNRNHLDLYAYRRADDGTMRMNWAHNSENWFFPAHFLDAMELVTLYDRQLRVPSPLHDFLVEYRYGPNYQVPIRTFGEWPYLLAPEEYTPTVIALMQELQQLTFTNIELKTQLASTCAPAILSELPIPSPASDRLAYLVRESYRVSLAERTARWGAFWRSLGESGRLARRVQRTYNRTITGEAITPVAYLLLHRIAHQQAEHQVLDAALRAEPAPP